MNSYNLTIYMKILSKTDLLRHEKCQTRLALDKKENPSKDRSIDESIQPSTLSLHRNQGGYAVEDIAEQLFDGIQKSTLFGVKGLLETQSLVFAKAPAISQASAQSNGNYARADILAKLPNLDVHQELRSYIKSLHRSSYGRFHALYEVKSATSVKKENYLDLAFQTHVFESSGYKIGRTFVINVNKDFVRESDNIDPNSFLNIIDVTDEVLEALQSLDLKIDSAHQTLNASSVPSVTIYKQCNQFQADRICPHINHCPNWNNLDSTKNPISYLPFLTKKKQDSFAKEGIFYIEDVSVDDTRLTKTQAPIVLAHKQDQPIINKQKLSEFLDQVDTQLPINFLDFETFTKVIPEIGHKPYQLIPILYSTAVMYPTQTKTISRNDLIERSIPSDSKFFAEQLINSIEPTGTVFSWYMSFEKSVINQLARMNPELESQLSSISDRMLDLRDPFFKGYYVDKRFEGTTKLKKVGSVIAQELSYENLEVDNGSLVGDLWYEMISSDDLNIQNRISTDLQKYCSMDTTSLITIYQFLQNIVK